MPSSLSTLLDFPRESRTQVRLAFLYQRDTPAEYPNGKRGKNDRTTGSASLLGFELLSAHWFHKVWEHYLSALGHGALPVQLIQRLGNYGRIQDGFGSLPTGLRQQLYEAHLRYGMRMLVESDPAPVGLAELVATPTLLSTEHVREGDWYLVEYRDGGSLPAQRQPNKLDEIVYASIGLSSDLDGPPRRGTVQRIVPLAVEDPALHMLLQALHFPQTAPPADTCPGEQEGPPDGGSPRIAMFGNGHLMIESAARRLPLTFGRRRDQPASTSSGRVASMNGIASGIMAPPRAGQAASGSTQHAQPQVQVQGNPMACNGKDPQPFVGINTIGAGNNTALYGRNSIVAYVDFGAPLPSNTNTYPGGDAPCVCGDPPIILSHWDYDHYAMARKVGSAMQRRWLAPQQVMGSVSARELYVRLLAAAPHGGALALWPVGTKPTHLEMPFGYVERGMGAPVNDDCLAVHVRTRDDPDGPAPAPWPAIFAPRPAPSAAASPVRCRAIIADNGLDAAWFDMSAHTRWRRAVAVPNTSLLLAWPPFIPKPGASGFIVMGGHANGRPIRAIWIPASGLPGSSHAGGGTATPVLPSGKPWPGGWAMSPSDFVDLGGCIVDFPSDAAGIPVDDIMCVSPTPGTKWAAPSGGAAAPGPGGGTWFAPTVDWQPVWRGGGWMVKLPSLGAAALAPLPAGPTAIVPATGTAPVRSAEEYILLPGDAGFQHLPSLQARRKAIASRKAVPAFVGMMATHHGSDSWIPDDPASQLAALDHIPRVSTTKIVYSYGTRTRGTNKGTHCYVKNNYGHPRPAAINAYCAAGWGMPESAGAHAFNRLNTAPYDFESKQPFNPLALPSGTTPGAANSKGHYNGNVALVSSTAPTTATLLHTCPHCAQGRSYFA